MSAAADKLFPPEVREALKKTILEQVNPENLARMSPEEAQKALSGAAADMARLSSGGHPRPAPITWEEWAAPDPPGLYMEILAGVEVQSGALTIIGARPGVGKTLFLINIAGELLHAGHKVAFYTFEEKGKKIVDKLIVNTWARSIINPADEPLAEIPPLKRLGRGKNDLITDPETGLLGPRIPAELWPATQKVREWIDEGTLKVWNPLQDAGILARELSEDADHVALIDYIQRIPIGAGNDGASRQLQIQGMLGELVGAAVASNRFVISAAQVNRPQKKSDAQKKRERWRGDWPVADMLLEELREAGDIEQEANIVIGINGCVGMPGALKPLTVQVLKDRDGSRIGKTAHAIHYGPGWSVTVTRDPTPFIDTPHADDPEGGSDMVKTPSSSKTGPDAPLPEVDY